MYIDDESITSVCNSDRYLANICKDPELWRQKVSSRLDMDVNYPAINYRELYDYLLYKDRDIKNNALIYAVHNNKSDFVIDLLETGADIEAFTGTWDGTPMIVSVRSGNIDMVRLLVKLGADINTSHGMPLRTAAGKGMFHISKLLIDMGADKNTFNDAFLNAVSSGHVTTTKLLLDNGVDVHYSDEYALYIASNSGFDDVVSLLLDNGANIEANYGMALRGAMSNNKFTTVKLLLDRGVRQSLINTVLLEAKDIGTRKMIKLLEQYLI